MGTFIQILVSIASIVTIGFGVWHFFVPKIWSWYNYIDKSAPELVLAVRAINVFFSLCLVLFGVMNMLLIWCRPDEQFSLLVVLGATAVLWATRVLMQLIYPQGTQRKAIQYSMLSTFVLTFCAYLVAFVWVLYK